MSKPGKKEEKKVIIDAGDGIEGINRFMQQHVFFKHFNKEGGETIRLPGNDKNGDPAVLTTKVPEVRENFVAENGEWNAALQTEEGAAKLYASQVMRRTIVKFLCEENVPSTDYRRAVLQATIQFRTLKKTDIGRQGHSIGRDARATIDQSEWTDQMVRQLHRLQGHGRNSWELIDYAAGSPHRRLLLDTIAFYCTGEDTSEGKALKHRTLKVQLPTDIPFYWKESGFGKMVVTYLADKELFANVFWSQIVGAVDGLGVCEHMAELTQNASYAFGSAGPTEMRGVMLTASSSTKLANPDLTVQLCFASYDAWSSNVATEVGNGRATVNLKLFDEQLTGQQTMVRFAIGKKTVDVQVLDRLQAEENARKLQSNFEPLPIVVTGIATTSIVTEVEEDFFRRTRQTMKNNNTEEDYFVLKVDNVNTAEKVAENTSYRVHHPTESWAKFACIATVHFCANMKLPDDATGRDEGLEWTVVLRYLWNHDNPEPTRWVPGLYYPDTYVSLMDRFKTDLITPFPVGNHCVMRSFGRSATEETERAKGHFGLMYNKVRGTNMVIRYAYNLFHAGAPMPYYQESRRTDTLDDLSWAVSNVDVSPRDDANLSIYHVESATNRLIPSGRTMEAGFGSRPEVFAADDTDDDDGRTVAVVSGGSRRLFYTGGGFNSSSSSSSSSSGEELD